MVNNPFEKYQKILSDNIKPNAIPILWNNWNDPRRGYHNIDHLKKMIKGIEKWNYRFSNNEFEQLIIAAFFHDAIYDPKDSKNHEDQSIKFFKQSYIGKIKPDLIERAIECTKYRKRPSDFHLRIFWDSDNAGFRDRYEEFLRAEHGIRKEFSFIPIEEYKKNRIGFLETNLGLFGPKGDNNIRRLIEYLNTI